MIFARFASLAFRTGQTLCECFGPGSVKTRSQLYVDDPAVTLAGPTAEVQSTIDTLLCWWLVFGLSLAWEKGMWALAGQRHLEHTSIGTEFFLIQMQGTTWG